jgi:hypothetical protein
MKFSEKRLALFCSAIGAISMLQPSIAHALNLQHKHCSQLGWKTKITQVKHSSRFSDGSLATDDSRGTFARAERVEFNDLLNNAAPASGKENCNYEISDITSITVNLIFEADGTDIIGKPNSVKMLWKRLNVGDNRILDIGVNRAWTSGEDQVFNFMPHNAEIDPAGPLPYELMLPKNNFIVALYDLAPDDDSYIFKSGSVTIEGQHYYTVPAPIGVVGLPLALYYSRRIRALSRRLKDNRCNPHCDG